MLEVRNLVVRYGAIEAVRDVSLSVRPGMVTAVLGANSAGKSSLLKAISGLVPAASGSIRMDGEDLTTLPPHRRARAGLAHVLEGRRLFHPLSVEENLRIAWDFSGKPRSFGAALTMAFDAFPVLGERRHSPARTLSGGQQQMLILSCSLIRGPRYLLLDEPSLGLAPIVVQQIFGFIGAVAREQGTAVLLSEQMASLALKVADYGYLLRRGQWVREGTAAELAGSDASELSAAYL